MNEREGDLEGMGAKKMEQAGKHWEGFQLLYAQFIKWHSVPAGVLKKKVKSKQNRINRSVNKMDYLNKAWN